MNILIANHHLKRTGGTENYSFALAEEMVRLGHQVEYFT
ncbi:MAG: UDP-glycosyltransferase, partial [Paludibacter sp.]